MPAKGGDTHPNPMVGAVIVEDEKIVSEGYHKQAGSPHAEVEAIRGLGREPKKVLLFLYRWSHVPQLGELLHVCREFLMLELSKFSLVQLIRILCMQAVGSKCSENQEYKLKWRLSSFSQKRQGLTLSLIIT